MYPIIPNDGTTPIPEVGTFFILAGNGIYMHKDTGVLSGYVPVKAVSFLDDFSPSPEIDFNLPRVTAGIVSRIRQFFAEVFKTHQSESCVLLYYGRVTGNYIGVIPAQNVGYAGVQYKRPPLSDILGGLVPVGTIHSHCDFDAFHSGIDVNDERHFDGLHVTFGHNDKDVIQVTASLVMNAHRFEVPPESVLDGLKKVDGPFYSVTVSTKFSDDELSLALRRVRYGLHDTSPMDPLIFMEERNAEEV